MRLDRARFALESLRVIGDAGPGDPRTTASPAEIGFGWSSVEQRPETMPFDEAPPGLYSQVALVFDGQGGPDSYEIRGHIMVGSEDRDFRIEDANPLAFNVAIDEMLSAGEQATIHLRINFKHALDAVNWSNVDISDGRFELDNGDPEMSNFRPKLIESFEIVNVTGAR